MSNQCRFFFICLIFIFALLVLEEQASAQYPEKPIRIIIPYGQGGATDTIGRMFAGYFEKALGKPVVIINKPGAGGAVGLAYVFQSQPDGYTIALGSDSSLSARPLMTDSGYTVEDIQPIARVVQIPMTIVVGANDNVNNLSDLITLMKQTSIAWSSPGVGSGPHIGAETFFHQYNISARHVPAKSAKEALVKLMSGEVQMISVVGSNVAGMIKGPKAPLEVLGVAAQTRWNHLPDSLTFIEQGYNFVRPVWFGFVAPKGTPKEVVDILSDEIKKVLSSNKSEEILAKLHLTSAYQGTDMFSKQIQKEKEKLSEVLTLIGMSK